MSIDDPRLQAIVDKHADMTRAKGRKDGRTGWIHFRLSLPWRFDQAISKAAKRRGINRAAYIRRALAHYAALDLEIDPMELIALCPLALRHGQVYSRSVPSTDRDDGAGFGDWRISRVDT